MIKHIEFLAIGEIIGFRRKDELEVKLLLPEDVITVLCKNYPHNLDIQVGLYILVRCSAYPGEEYSSFMSEFISILKPERTMVKVIPMEEENVCCDLKGNKYILSSKIYAEADQYAQGYIDIGFTGVPEEINEPLYVTEMSEFYPYTITATGAIDLCIEMLGRQVIPLKEQSDYRLVLVRLLELLNGKNN